MFLGKLLLLILLLVLLLIILLVLVVLILIVVLLILVFLVLVLFILIVLVVLVFVVLILIFLMLEHVKCIGEVVPRAHIVRVQLQCIGVSGNALFQFLSTAVRSPRARVLT